LHTIKLLKMIKIEKNVPLPDKFGNVGFFSKEILDTLSKMEVGDSIVLNIKEYKIYVTVKRMLNQPDKVFVARVTEKKGDKFRIFRTK
jgi:hypothetical protein